MREFLKKLEEFSKLDADDSLSTVGDLARLVPFPAPAELAAFMAELVSLQRRLDRIEDYPELVASGIKQRAMDLQADAVILIERINRDSCLTGLAKLQQRLLEAVWATGRIKTTELALLLWDVEERAESSTIRVLIGETNKTLVKMKAPYLLSKHGDSILLERLFAKAN